MSDAQITSPPEQLAIAGSGAIACGLAASAARHGGVLLWARSPSSAQRARAQVNKLCGRLSGEVNAAQVVIVEELEALSPATFLVEAVVEEMAAKAELLKRLGAIAGPEAVLATTTSSLSVADLAAASGHPERFVGLHVFNPVTKMKLVELAYPPEASHVTRQRARALCEGLGKTPVEVPDLPGFVVNRLLFPYLFSAVGLMSETGLSAADVDACMTLGAGHPLGPLALLDLVGLDVAQAIAGEINVPVPAEVAELVSQGALGRKTGRGFHAY